MATENEQILSAIQSFRTEVQAEIHSFRTEVQAEIQSFRTEVQAEIQSLKADVMTIDNSLKAEVKRWDDRFFKFAEDSTNRSNTLIASATISVIAGVVLILLRQ